MTIPPSSLSSRTPVPKAIWAIGLASFLINVSSVIVFGLSAVYMKTILGVATGWIGLLEGIVEASAYAVKVFSGVFSDYLKRRKIIMVWGFGLATLARPILALSSSFGAVFTSRVLDRIGNGVQSTPRDALVGDLSPESIKGTCYGLRQSLATAGSFFGGIVGVAAMLLTNQNFHQVFWIATIPAVMGLLILIFAVKDSPTQQSGEAIKRHPIRIADLHRLGGTYWMLMIVAGVFMLARVGEAMLILHAHQNFGLSESYIPLILILYNGTNSLASYPIGRLSDKVSRYALLGIGFAVLIVADILLATATNLSIMLMGVAVWGVQIGITQSMFMALIADTVPNDLRGTGFGFFYLTSAIALVLAGTMGGTIAQLYGEAMTFTASGIIGAVSLATLLILIPFRKKATS
ncbi:MFS transporter [Candidatus Finniella inopinata]|uniref:MFS transporter n=1 Tax=Candidatus Finniella inopinata TaxID=1696036 RepID=A0A4Q7DGR1_9PROT|nr:MFS transporter [Candidatus Finniella inopinata]RZI45269.1 MFS transporter [Candidatus Finniella inopinata]